MIDKILCKLGKYDIPVCQKNKQPDFIVDLLQSNVVLFGSTQSGKTNILKLIINILHKKMNTDTEQIFILDFGAALAEYKKMPLVSAYFDNSNEEYVKRVFKILENKLKENTEILDGEGFSKKKNDQPKHITFLIDNFNAFLDEPRYSTYQEKFSRICRDGISRGISVVITASETKGTSQYLNNFAQKIAVNLTDENYMNIFGRRVTSIGNIAGRGFANITYKGDITDAININAPYEIHCSFAEAIGADNFKSNLIKKYGMPDEKGNFEKQVPKYKIFPTKLYLKDCDELMEKDEKSKFNKNYSVCAGLDYVDFKQVVCDFSHSRFVAVYAKRDFGSNILLERIIVKLMQLSKRKLVLFDDGRGLLKKFSESKFVNEYESKDVKYISKYEQIPMKVCNTTAVAKKSMERKTEQGFEMAVPLNTGGNMQLINDIRAQASAGISVQPARTVKNDEKKWVEIKRKLSPMQQLYKYIHENCMDIGNYGDMLYTGSKVVEPKRSDAIPQGCETTEKDSTVFVIQSKLSFSSVDENKKFMNHILPMLADIAEDRDYIFIFSDVKKMSDTEMNEKFNSIINSVFVLDNIAEFVSERGQKSIFSDMDVKTLKSDYAKCELGDGYFYDIEADNLKKLKFFQDTIK